MFPLENEDRNYAYSMGVLHLTNKCLGHCVTYGKHSFLVWWYCFGSLGNLITSMNMFKKGGLRCKLLILQSICCLVSKGVLYYQNSTVYINKALSLNICQLRFKILKRHYSFLHLGKKNKDRSWRPYITALNLFSS